MTNMRLPTPGAVGVDPCRKGTRFSADDGDALERAGYRPGWNHLSDGTWAWYRHVGTGYMLVVCSRLVRRRAKKRAERLARTRAWGDGRFWDYRRQDTENLPSWDNGTNARNGRLFAADPVEFVARVVAPMIARERRVK